jgi:hypothetical protein
MTKVTRPPIIPPEVPYVPTPPPSVGAPVPPVFLDPVFAGSQYPADPQIMLSVSEDGGKTWSEWITRSMGKLGEYQQRISWNRLGDSDKMVLRFALSDPAPLTVIDLEVEMEGGQK